jgi:ribonucleotide reductase alpha subunit
MLTTKVDPVSGIYETLALCAKISIHAGDIGMCFFVFKIHLYNIKGLASHNIRAKGSYGLGTNGIFNGLVPMLRVFDATRATWTRKRRTASPSTSSPGTPTSKFPELKENNGKEEQRARPHLRAVDSLPLHEARGE